MLEHEVLKLPLAEADEYKWLLRQLKLTVGAGKSVRLKQTVLKEGYSTTNLSGFIAEFRQRLTRLSPLHERLTRQRTATALRDFIRQSRHECQSLLARYCFTPAEVVARIGQRLRRSRGLKDLDAFASSPDTRLLRREVKLCLAQLPDYEAAILKGLCTPGDIYWVADATGAELNSLVETPLTTVAVVIKPPGSQLEFEIKRTGRKGLHPLNVVFRRAGKQLPVAHYLDGGSMGKQLGFEARSGCRFSHLYRAVHQSDPPLSNVYSTATIYTVPTPQREEHLLSYFTEAPAFGAGFRQMRRAMQEVVQATRESNNLLAIPGDLGLTVQFLGLMEPAQAILAGSSSFRIDRLALYLSHRGPQAYFKEGLKVPYTASDARWLADELLREILPRYTPPTVGNCGYRKYVTQALALRANRARADATYLSLVRQLGTLWGTLMGAGGYAWGESFVARNMGLKGYWRGGQWQVKLISMDHDNLFLPGYDASNFHPLEALNGMLKDEKFILGSTIGSKPVTGTLTHLGDIYRVDARAAVTGSRQFRQALRQAYRKTQVELPGNQELRRAFSRLFVEQVCYWNELVASYLKVRRHSRAVATWRAETDKRLTEKWGRPALTAEYLNAMEEYADFLERYSFLYQQ